MRTIPTVDVSSIGLHRAEVMQEDLSDVGLKLHHAFTTCGFVYLVNHGVSPADVDVVFSSTRNFCTSQSVEAKEARFPRDPVTTHGYVRVGREMLDQLKEEPGVKATREVREAIDVCGVSEEFAYPEDTDLRAQMKIIKDQVVPLALRILQAVAVSLGLEPQFFTAMHKKMLHFGNQSKIRALFYPPIEGEVAPDTTRCGEHADYGTLTFLFQDDLGGLEVKAQDEGWIEALPVEGSILLNVGELLEIFTNGLFPATRHRVVIPEEEILQRQARQSLAFFIHPDDEVLVKPIRDEEPKSDKYACIGAGEHVQKQLAATYVY